MSGAPDPPVRARLVGSWLRTPGGKAVQYDRLLQRSRRRARERVYRAAHTRRQGAPRLAMSA